jgi:hypothetical protein
VTEIVTKFHIPRPFIAVHPFSENFDDEERNLNHKDRNSLLNYLSRIGLHGVVVGRAAKFGKWIERDKRVTGLTGETDKNVLQAFELVRQAVGFIGCA